MIMYHGKEEVLTVMDKIVGKEPENKIEKDGEGKFLEDRIEREDEMERSSSPETPSTASSW